MHQNESKYKYERNSINRKKDRRSDKTMCVPLPMIVNKLYEMVESWWSSHVRKKYLILKFIISILEESRSRFMILRSPCVWVWNRKRYMGFFAHNYFIIICLEIAWAFEFVKSFYVVVCLPSQMQSRNMCMQTCNIL